MTPRTNHRSDVLIVGGGVIGAACADRLAGEGYSVRLIDRGAFARESSWAAAGIVHPVHPWKYPEPLPTLFKTAMRDHPALCEDLLARTGIDSGLRPCGLEVQGSAAARIADWWGTDTRWEKRREDCIFLPDACRIQPPRFTRALLEGARQRGAELLSHTPALSVEPGRVETPRGTFEADFVVLAAGSWSGELRPEAPTRPVRGQILLFRGSIPHMTIFADGSYAVPRDGNRFLFGSTLEKAGFDPRPREESVSRLQEKAYEHCGGAATLLEWDAEIPSFEVTHQEALKARQFAQIPSPNSSETNSEIVLEQAHG